MDYTKNTAVNAYIKVLEDIHHETRLTTNNPEDTIKAFLERYNIITLGETLAAMLQHYSWDGRISKKNIEWADTWVFPEKMVQNAGTDKIHMCHLDQLATTLRRWEA